MNGETKSKVILGCVVVMVFAWVWLVSQRAAWTMDNSPVVYLECLPRDTYGELEDHLPEWGFLGLEIVAHYDSERHLWSAQHGYDCGNFGPWHLQPPDPFELNVTSDTECPWDDDPQWRDWMIAIGYSDHSAELQANAWIDIVGPTVGIALAKGASNQEAAGIAAMCNSGPAHVRRWAAERDTWELMALIDAYLDHRDTAHRRRRVYRILGRYWDSTP